MIPELLRLPVPRHVFENCRLPLRRPLEVDRPIRSSKQFITECIIACITDCIMVLLKDTKPVQIAIDPLKTEDPTLPNIEELQNIVEDNDDYSIDSSEQGAEKIEDISRALTKVS